MAKRMLGLHHNGLARFPQRVHVSHSGYLKGISDAGKFTSVRQFLDCYRVIGSTTNQRTAYALIRFLQQDLYQVTIYDSQVVAIASSSVKTVFVPAR